MKEKKSKKTKQKDLKAKTNLFQTNNLHEVVIKG